MVAVLFVSDIQERFRTLIHGMKAMISATRLLVQVWGLLGLPIVVTEQSPAKLGKTVTELEDVLSKIPSSQVIVSSKTQFSMLTPEVSSFLELHHATSGVIVGLEAHICVLQTARDLLSRHIEAAIVVDAVSSQRKFDRSVALRSLEKTCTLTTTESIIFQLLRDASHPSFRTVAALNKERATLLTGPDDEEKMLLEI